MTAMDPLSSYPDASGLAAGRGRVRGRHQRTTIDNVTYKIADCRQEREDAFRLIHDVYVSAGLMTPNPARMRVTSFHLLPTTDLFVAYHKKTVIYTMTLIGDDSLGMPLEEVYGPEVQQRRTESSLYFAEVSCLAAKQGYFPRKQMFHVFVNLAALLVQSARENGVDRLVIACHPRHARFYQSFLGFQQIGGRRVYSPTLNNLAVALEHDFAALDRTKYKLYDQIYAPAFKNLELFHQPMLKGDRDHFCDTTEFAHMHFPLESVT